MFLDLRFWRVLFSSAILPRKPLREKFRLKFRVWPHDSDFNLHLNNAQYQRLFDFGRFQYCLRVGLMRFSDGQLPAHVMGANYTEFRSELPLFCSIRLETELYYWDGKWIYLRQRVFRKDTLAAVCYTKILIRFGTTLNLFDKDLTVLFGPNSTPPSDLPLSLLDTGIV